MSKKAVSDFVVVNNKALNDTNFLITLESAVPLPPITAGQFVNVEIRGSGEIFLRRPFSVFAIDHERNTLSLIVKILGRGSAILAKIKPGEVLNLIYPLGRGFTYPQSHEKILLIGGGSGVAPLLFLARDSGLPANQVDILIGARSAADHIRIEEYDAYAQLHHTTEDGSLGTKGLVTHHPLFFRGIEAYDRVYACGPDGMMKAVAAEAYKKQVRCEVSLENLMACGFGVCLCCIEPTVNGNLCVCTEGPVFDINDLKWQI